MSDKGSIQNWKAFAGSVWAKFGAPTDRDLDRLWGRRHKLAPRAMVESLDQKLAAAPVQEPARV